MIKAITIGASAGGLHALEFLLPKVSSNCSIPIFIAQHISADSDSYYVNMLSKYCQVVVKEPFSTEKIKSGTVYIAPPDYHMLIEPDYTLSINTDEKINYSRPSIDVLFETAAELYKNNLLGILLTGSNSDGSNGLLRIKELGGTTVVENPDTAYMSEMPLSAIRLLNPDRILHLDEIAALLSELTQI